MTKKTALQLIATVALAAGFIGVSGVTANAADTDSQSTTATVGLTAGTTDPDGPHAGAVQLIAAPDLVFGDATKGTTITGGAQSIAATSLTTNATSTSLTSTNLDSTVKAAVKDGDVAVNNPGTDDGWTVSVQAANFTKTTGDKADLLGAVINFKGAVASGNSDATTKPAVAATPSVTAGGPSATILSATNGNGVGTWMNRLTKDTNLDIAAGNTQGTYTSNLTWTIANTPSTQA
ncbi:WxL domain-containing protein [Levilactobacillus tujiorum]|uniref:WxL domain-containing protein n=1 Tax=Levilactobacillus tujiorum TaxID=2912243 RepID=UPI001456798B|nr:WxL domain-containing protein [Levilactobacillus tujiorum]NLR31804.1 hypothetical protein [Levilactobacillus tujiorum]